MLPVLIHIGPITIRTYGFMFALGVLLGLFVALKLASREGIDRNQYSDYIFLMMIASLIGAKLLLLITNLNYYLKYPSELKYLLISGGTYYGGLITAFLFSLWYIHRKKMPFRVIGDITVPGVALGHFFGRLGCFAAGCCWGRHAEGFPLAIHFGSEKAHELTGVPLHTPLYPTQITEAILNLANFLILLWLFPRRRYKGLILVFYFLNYSLIRFVLEYFRGDPDRGYIFGNLQEPFLSLSVPQLISLAGICTAIVLHFVFKRNGEQKNLS